VIEVRADSEPDRADQPIRIAFVIDRLFLPAGGTETQLIYLLEHLDRARFEVKVFCLQSSDWIRENISPAEAEVVDLHMGRTPVMLSGIRRLSRSFREARVDIVQTYFRDANIAGILAASQAGVSSIVSTRRGVPYWSNAAGLFFLKWLNRKATHFLANSEATANRLVRAEGVGPGRVDVIHNGLEPSRFAPRTAEDGARLKSSIGVSAAGAVVGVVANLRVVKGLDVFLRAASHVLEVIPSSQFVIVGRGEEEQNLKALARELRIESQVQFLGAREDVPALLRAFDVGVLASRFESFSNSILEYLASDLPVVVTDVGGAREAVRDGRDGFIVPAEDASAMADRILSLLRHPGGPHSWRQEPGLAERFHVGAMVRAHEAFYTRIVEA
jgi:L-malate glycosyltransferase